MARNWAICIGVSEYDFISSLKYAHRDAEELGKLLKDKAGFEKVYVFTKDSPAIDDMSQGFPSHPTRSNILQWLGKRFKKAAKKPLSLNDNLWFFFSGHGWEHQGKHYLLLSGTSDDPEFLPETAISVEMIRSRLRNYSGAGNIIMLIDACRDSGKKSINTAFDKQQGVITIASCEPHRVSYEIDAIKHGSFTYALLKSLQRLGENNCATVERLCNSLRTEVPLINATHKKGKQVPYTVIEPESKYHLFLLPEYIKPTDKDIACLREKAKDAELEGDYEMAEIMWDSLVTLDSYNALKALKRIWTRNINPVSIAQNRQETTMTSDLTKDAKGIEETPFDLLSDQEFSFETVKVDSRGEEINRETKSARYFSQDLGNGISLDMVYIPGGTFIMGTEEEEIERLCKKYDVDWFKNESPQHKVTVPPFYMSKYPITQAQWKTIAQQKDLKVKEDLEFEPSYFKENPKSFSFPSIRRKSDLPYYGDNPTYLDRPVEQINWYQAKEFCDRLSKLTEKEYRLPSEAQWEYACRADPPKSPFSRGTSIPKSSLERVTSESPTFQGGVRGGFPFHFGETITSDLVNYDGNYIYADEQKGVYREETTPVGMFLPNAFGLYDMHGNVWEWCEDDWHGNYDNAPTDGSAWITENNKTDVLRGGSWDDNPEICRCATRSSLTRAIIDYRLGFRVVCVFGRTI